jgi:hypothetical protein
MAGTAVPFLLLVLLAVLANSGTLMPCIIGHAWQQHEHPNIRQTVCPL